MTASPASTRAPPTSRRRSATPTEKPGDVEVVRAVQVGHLGGLAAEQRAAGLATAVGDALDELGDAIGVEPADRDAVEEQHRLGAAGDDVVDAHRDEVDAELVQPPGLALQERLRADGVGAGGEHRDRRTSRPRPGPAKPPSDAEHERRAGRLDRGAQAVDDGVRGVERDARLGVGQRRELAHRTPLTSKRPLVERSALLGRDRVLAGQARAAEAGGGALDRELQPLEAEVGERVGADQRADLVERRGRRRSARRASAMSIP